MPGAEDGDPAADIVIVEGLNVIGTGPAIEGQARVFVSDLFDFTIYVDAETDDIRAWSLERFLTLRNTTFPHLLSYFPRYAGLSDAEAVETAAASWDEINEPNLRGTSSPPASAPASSCARPGITRSRKCACAS